MKQTLKKTARRILGNSRYDNLFYSLHHRRLVVALGLPSGKAVGEDVFLARWHRLSHHVDRYSYRLYSNYCGPTPNIVPHDLLHNTIEPALNPPELWDEYEDKNNFARYVGADILPQTVAFR